MAGKFTLLSFENCDSFRGALVRCLLCVIQSGVGEIISGEEEPYSSGDLLHTADGQIDIREGSEYDRDVEVSLSCFLLQIVYGLTGTSVLS